MLSDARRVGMQWFFGVDEFLRVPSANPIPKGGEAFRGL